MSYRGGEILIQLFQNLGIEYVFCSPGTEWTALWEGLSERYGHGDNSVKYINCRHETLAVSAAIGYSQAARKPASVLLHANLGPLNSAMAIRAAQWAQAPIIICSSYTAEYDEDKGHLTTESHWLSRLSDIGGPSNLVKPYVKWSNNVTSKEAMVDSIIRGWQIAQSTPQGPVFIAIPRELLVGTANDLSVPSSYAVPSPPEPHQNAVDEAAKTLVAAKHPIIITEHAGENPQTVDKMTELAELLSIPVYEYTSPMYANFPKSHLLHQGYDASKALSEADVILLVGAVTPWYPPSLAPRDNPRIIAVDSDPLHPNLPYHGYRIDSYISGDMEKALSELIKAADACKQNFGSPDSIYQNRLKQYSAEHVQMAEQWETEALAEKSAVPISAKWFHYLANQLLPENTVGVIETLTQTRYAHRYFTNMKRYFRTSGGGLGIGFGIAIGTKLAYRDTPVVYFVGDGSFNYNPVLAGLGLCQEYNIPILTCVFNNSSYAAMKLGYDKEGWAATHNSFLGVDILPSPEYIKIAEAFNISAIKLKDPGDIEPALKRTLESLNHGKSALIDVTM